MGRGATSGHTDHAGCPGTRMPDFYWNNLISDSLPAYTRMSPPDSNSTLTLASYISTTIGPLLQSCRHSSPPKLQTCLLSLLSSTSCRQCQGSIAGRPFPSKMGKRFLHQLLAVVLVLFVSPARSGDWLPATATFYGGADDSDTMANNLSLPHAYMCV